MKVRAKFAVTKVAELGDWNGNRLEITKNVSGSAEGPQRFESTGIPVREITMTAVYGGSSENQSFAEATPNGTITFQLNNPACADEFKPGDSYYLEFERIEK